MILLLQSLTIAAMNRQCPGAEFLGLICWYQSAGESAGESAGVLVAKLAAKFAGKSAEIDGGVAIATTWVSLGAMHLGY